MRWSVGFPIFFSQCFLLYNVISCLPSQLNDKALSADNTRNGEKKNTNPEEISPIQDKENEAQSYLEEINRKSSEKCFETQVVEWQFATDINDENEKAKLEASLSAARFQKEMWSNLTRNFPSWKSFSQDSVLRQFKKLTVLGTAALPDDKLQEYNQIVTSMKKIYSTAKICAFQDKAKCGLNLEPELKEILKSSRDYDELKYVWKEWREQSGKKMRQLYERFVELSNEAASINNFADTGAYWLREYESDTIKQDIESLWQTLKPLYQQIHAYVRGKLRQVYGKNNIPENAPIPAHLLGNMWAQSWENIYDITVPFPNKTSIDVTEQMKKQGYTPLKMFEKSDEFFTSLGLIPMPPEFWKHSVIEKPTDREIVCHASAWDFCNGKDFRIKQCTVVSTEDLVVVHHEMGHIQYYLQYKSLPHVFRRGANPGFHEAVGDTLALSVQTPKHLKEIGLLDEATPIDDFETSINFLFTMALDKIAFLPFAYLMDKWRWDIFDGSVPSSDYNCHWWKLREEYQGLRSPVTRTEDDFDAGAKYHIPSNVEYLRYFVSAIIQFQFHRSLCQVANQYDPKDPSRPLHNCDIYRSKEAGARLAAMLSMGSSRPWPEAMQALTGQERMDATAIREYFRPLEIWLEKANKELGETPGWTIDNPSCQSKSSS